jgi:hypothetical protein
MKACILRAFSGIWPMQCSGVCVVAQGTRQVSAQAIFLRMAVFCTVCTVFYTEPFCFGLVGSSWKQLASFTGQLECGETVHLHASSSCWRSVAVLCYWGMRICKKKNKASGTPALSKRHPAEDGRQQPVSAQGQGRDTATLDPPILTPQAKITADSPQQDERTSSRWLTS